MSSGCHGRGVGSFNFALGFFATCNLFSSLFVHVCVCGHIFDMINTANAACGTGVLRIAASVDYTHTFITCTF